MDPRWEESLEVLEPELPANEPLILCAILGGILLLMLQGSGGWKFGSKMAREPGRFGAQIASIRAPTIACNLGGIVAADVTFSLAAKVGREIAPKCHILAGNIGDIAGNLLVILPAF